MTEVENGVQTAPKAAYTVQQFCAAYGIGRSLFYDEVSSGRLRVKKVGRRTLILATDAAAWRDALPDGRDAA